MSLRMPHAAGLFWSVNVALAAPSALATLAPADCQKGAFAA